jgi:type IV pilus assembly protein PilA
MPRNGERGFTMIELLVVMLIIGVLTAIAVPSFLNQRSKAQDAEAKSAATVAGKALEIYSHAHDSYLGVDRDALVDIEGSLAQARGLVVEGTEDGYTLTVESAAGAAGGGPYMIERDGDDVIRTCTTPGRGGCPEGDGGW